MNRFTMVVFLLFLAPVASVNGAVIIFTSQAAWEASVGSITTEDFNGAASSFLANTTGNSIGSITTLDLLGGVNDPGPSGLTGNGFLQSEVDSSSVTTGDGLSIRFNFPTAFGFALVGLQNDSVATPSGLNLNELGFVIDGQMILLSDALGLTDSSDGNPVGTVSNTAPVFIGFVSTNAITSFEMVHGDLVAPGGVAGGNEEFYINELKIAGSAAAVPEPSTFALLGMGAVVLIGYGRRKQKQAA